ncbi:MAG: tRNA pseudouridine(38-40) synthase TruA [Pseudomonadota bacterium]
MSTKTHYSFGVAYVGSRFHGWQVQTDQFTVQGELERALSQIADQPVKVNAAGRTDKGVHATGQVAGFSTTAQRSAETWLRGLRGLTPQDLGILWLREVPARFHPRYSAVSRRYRYLFFDAEVDNVFSNERTWSRHLNKAGAKFERLDADIMHANAQSLVGEHDFTTFRGAGCQSLTPMRRVNRCQVVRQGDLVVMDIEANAFVLHMVRNIARGLVESSIFGSWNHIRDLLECCDRADLGATAPPHGLYLAGVSYPEYDFPMPPSPMILSV